MTRRSFIPLATLAAAGLALAGCAGTAPSGTDPGPADDTVRVVSTTNVYGQIAQQIGGDRVDVDSLITSAAQDPHSYEPSARDQLTVSRAELVIENGGGYDAFVEALVEASDADAHVITVAELSHDWPGDEGDHEHSDDEQSDEAAADGDSHTAEEHADEEHADEEHTHDEGDDHAHDEGDDHAHDENGDHDHDDHDHVAGFNEHVWYQLHTVEHFAEEVAAELTELRPDAADEFEANLATFLADLGAVEDRIAEIAEAHGGELVFATEPVALYLVADAGLENVSPGAFLEAVEEGQDVPAATLLESIGLLESGDVRALVSNTQTGGAETTQLEQEAETQGVPVVGFAETLPEGATFAEWMSDNAEALNAALAG